MLKAKQSVAPLPPRDFADDIPPQLEGLCLQLLARAPADRPTGDQILARLGVADQPTPAQIGATRNAWSDDVFVGRNKELTELRSAMNEATTGVSRCVLLSGPLGIGKSSLIEYFSHELRDSKPTPMLLSGRCHERESLHYKALDNIIDQLSCYLADYPDDLIANLAPDPPAALMQVFPVLRRVPLWADAPAPTGSPHALRQRAVESLRDLLAGLAQLQPVVLCIDDLHWAGGDSLELLLDLLWRPAPAGVLVLATLSSNSLTCDATLRHHIASLESLDMTTRLELGPLSPHEQHALMDALSDHFGGKPGPLDAMHQRAWRDSAGHPMLLVEIARHAAEPARGGIGARVEESEQCVDLHKPGTGLQLEDIIRERIDHLPDTERLLLRLIAVAGEPMPLRLLAEVGTLSLADVERAAAFLRIERLARISRSEDEPWLDTYHQKVRHAVVARLPALRVRGLHTELARALERWRKPRAALMARQWLLAGNLERAARYLMNAATEAADSLAFEHAAKLYATARELTPQLSGHKSTIRSIDLNDDPTAADSLLATTELRPVEVSMD